MPAGFTAFLWCIPVCFVVLHQAWRAWSHRHTVIMDTGDLDGELADLIEKNR